MARQSEGPWYRQLKDGWYLKVRGKQLSLEVKGEKNRQQAIGSWHPRRLRKPLEAIPKAKAGTTVKELVEAFLADAKARVKATTYATYHGCLTAFSEKHGKAKAEALTVARALAFVNRDR